MNLRFEVFWTAVSGIEPSTAGADGDVHAPSVDGLRGGRGGAMWKSGAQKTGGLCAESWELKVAYKKKRHVNFHMPL